MIDRLLDVAVAAALLAVFALDPIFSSNLSRAFGPNPMANLHAGQIEGWQWGILFAPFAYAIGRLLRRL